MFIKTFPNADLYDRILITSNIQNFVPSVTSSASIITFNALFQRLYFIWLTVIFVWVLIILNVLSGNPT